MTTQQQEGPISVRKGEGAPTSVTSVVPATVPLISRGFQLADVFIKASAAERAGSGVLGNTSPADEEARKVAELAHERAYAAYQVTEKSLMKAITDATWILSKTVGMCDEQVLPTGRTIVADGTEVEDYRMDMLSRNPYKIAHELPGQPMNVKVAELFEIGTPGGPLTAVVRKQWYARQFPGGGYNVESAHILYLRDLENGGVIQIRWSNSDDVDSEPTVTLRRHEQAELEDLALIKHPKVLPEGLSAPTTISVEGSFMPNITGVSDDTVALGKMLDGVFRAAVSDDTAKSLVTGKYKVRPPQQ